MDQARISGTEHLALASPAIGMLPGQFSPWIGIITSVFSSKRKAVGDWGREEAGMQMRFHPEWVGLHLTYFLFAIFYKIKVILKNCQEVFHLSDCTHTKNYFCPQKPTLGCIFQERNLTRHPARPRLELAHGKFTLPHHKIFCLYKCFSFWHVHVFCISGKYVEHNPIYNLCYCKIKDADSYTKHPSLQGFKWTPFKWGQDIDGLSVTSLGKKRSVV